VDGLVKVKANFLNNRKNNSKNILKALLKEKNQAEILNIYCFELMLNLKVEK
jgi:hypothetical protein